MSSVSETSGCARVPRPFHHGYAEGSVVRRILTLGRKRVRSRGWRQRRARSRRRWESHGRRVETLPKSQGRRQARRNRPLSDTRNRDEQQRRRGASQTAALAGHCTSRCSSPRARRVLTAALRGGATAASDGALFAQTRSRGCQQAPAVTPALRWTGSEQQSEPPRLALSLCHGSDSHVDCVVVTVGDHRTVCSPQPAAAERRPPSRGARFPGRA